MIARPMPGLMLTAAVIAQAATTVVATAPAFLIPLLHDTAGLSLAEAGLLAAAPNLGLVLSLVAWGAATDRWGERRVLVAGLAATTLAIVLSMLASGFVWLGLTLVLSGALSGCTNASSGRLIVGWFPPERRGLAMGIRQTCQPVGVAAAALAVPALASGAGIAAALAFGGVLCLVSLIVCTVVVVDPARPPHRELAAAANPYRGTGVLARIHAVSVLLVVPQFALSTFGLVWFIAGFGWSAIAAGLVVSAAQLLGAAGRIAAGAVSDRVGSRLGPLRWVAIAGIAAMGLTAAFGALGLAIPAAIAFVVASCVSVADNGLAFTAVAEIAGPRWAGRALGIQNTGQFLAAAIVSPAFGALIGAVGYPLAWAIGALAPLAAVPLVPRAGGPALPAPPRPAATNGLPAPSRAEESRSG